MSKRWCPVLQSTEPLASKRPRAEDSFGSSDPRGCRYERCERFGWLESGKGVHYPFCRLWHQNFHMDDLYEKYRHGGARVLEKPRGTCLLPTCTAPVVQVDESTIDILEFHDFCRRRHVREYVRAKTRQWKLEGRLCKHEGCDNHVQVEEASKKIREFCCDDHDFAAAAAEGKREAVASCSCFQRALGSSVDAAIVPSAKSDGQSCATSGDHILEKSAPQGDEPRPGLQANIGHEPGYHSIDLGEGILHCLKSLHTQPGDDLKADPNNLFCRVENVTNSHPSEKVPGFVPKFFLHESSSNWKITRSLRWKRSSAPHKGKGTDELMETTYFSLYLDGRLYVSGGTKEGFGEVWRLHQYSLSAKCTKELTGGEPPQKGPVISKIYKEKKRLKGKELSGGEDNASGPERRLATCVGNKSIPSDTSPPPREGLAVGGEGLQGNSHGFHDIDLPDCPFELMAHHLDTPDGALREFTDFVEDEGRSSSFSSDGSPREVLESVNLQGSSYNKTAELDGSPDILAANFLMPENMEMDSNGSSAPISVRGIPEMGFSTEEMGLRSCISSSGAHGDNLAFGGETLQELHYNRSGELDDWLNFLTRA